MSSRRMYGYEMSEGIYSADEKEAQFVKMIFKDYINGKRLNQLADVLNAEKIPTTQNGQWHQKYISKILRDQRYLGDELHEPLITNSEFNLAQQRLDRYNHRMGKTREYKTEISPYYGMVYCERSRKKFCRTNIRGLGHVWHCWYTSEHTGKCSCCVKGLGKIKDETIQYGFLSLMKNLYQNPMKLEKPPKPVNNSRYRRLVKKLEDVKKNAEPYPLEKMKNLLLELSAAEYALLDDGSDEVIKMHLLDKGKLDDFDGELLKAIVRKIYINNQHITFELINQQELKIAIN